MSARAAVLASLCALAAACGWTAPSECRLPFEAGPCDAVIPVWAAVGGTCYERTYGGCEGNANRFVTREECMARCQGQPEPYGCPSGRVKRKVCISCGSPGGCGSELEVCALPCATPSTCSGPLQFCTDGVCQVGGCI